MNTMFVVIQEVLFLADYAKAAAGSGLLLIVGVVLVAVSNLVVIPSQYKTFLGIPYEANPEYALSLILKASLMIFGIVTLVSAPLYAIMEMTVGHFRVSLPPSPGRYHEPPPPITPSQKMYCVSCGAENPLEASFCFKCGKKLVRS